MKISVWNYIGGVASPYIPTAAIAAAIGAPALEQQIDLDAMMVFDDIGDETFTAPGDTIMFSIAPIPGAFDGGEIWVWNVGAGIPAPFLVHGGEVWSTSVMGHFAGYGFIVDENINALEAVPEPATLAVLLVGGLLVLKRRTR